MPNPHWLKSDTPAFTLTAEQRAILDAARSDDTRTMYLQQWHQAHCWEHLQVNGVFGSLDPAWFTRRWTADFGDLAEAWDVYRPTEARSCGRSTFGMAA